MADKKPVHNSPNCYECGEQLFEGDDITTYQHQPHTGDYRFVNRLYHTTCYDKTELKTDEERHMKKVRLTGDGALGESTPPTVTFDNIYEAAALAFEQAIIHNDALDALTDLPASKFREGYFGKIDLTMAFRMPLREWVVEVYEHGEKWINVKLEDVDD